MYELLPALYTYLGTEPDGIPSMFLKSCRLALVRPLYLLFNKSLSLGHFPDFWKKSFVTPIYKSGDKHNVSNYRSIDKMSLIPKKFESIITKKLTAIMSP